MGRLILFVVGALLAVMLVLWALSALMMFFWIAVIVVIGVAAIKLGFRAGRRSHR